jgi:hypothetical protein
MCFSTSEDLDELLRKSILSGFYLNLVCPFSCPILSSNSWKAHSAGARPLLFGNKSGSREVEGRRGVNIDLKAQTRRSPEFVSTFMQGAILECIWCIWCAVWITISCQSQSNPKNAGMQPSRLNVRFAPNTSVSPYTWSVFLRFQVPSPVLHPVLTSHIFSPLHWHCRHRILVPKVQCGSRGSDPGKPMSSLVKVKRVKR